jgi:chromosome segregation ATPase
VPDVRADLDHRERQRQFWSERRARWLTSSQRIEQAREYEKGLGKLRADVAQHEEDLKTARATDPVPEKFYKGEQEQQAAIGALAEQQKSAKAQFDDASGARVATLEAELRELQARRSAAVSEAMQPTEEMREAEEQPRPVPARAA